MKWCVPLLVGVSCTADAPPVIPTPTIPPPVASQPTGALPSADLPSSASDLQRLVLALELGSDDAFRAVLQADKQRSDHTAPEALRRLMTGREILRMDMGQGYRHEAGHHALSWWFSDVGMVGRSQQVGAYVDSALEAASLSRNGDDPATFKGTTDAYETTVHLRGPHGWTGGSRQAAGIELMWSARSTTTSPQLTVSELLQVMPYFRDADIDAELYQELGDELLVGAALGGTWTRYYALSLELVNRDALPARLVAMLERSGFERQDNADSDDGVRLLRKHSGSHAQIGATKQGHVSLHIQPRS